MQETAARPTLLRGAACADFGATPGKANPTACHGMQGSPLRAPIAEHGVPLKVAVPYVRVRNTFIDSAAPRSPSLEAFYREREVQTCPSKQAAARTLLYHDACFAAASSTGSGGGSAARGSTSASSPFLFDMRTPGSSEASRVEGLQARLAQRFADADDDGQFPAVPAMPADAAGRLDLGVDYYPDYSMDYMPPEYASAFAQLGGESYDWPGQSAPSCRAGLPVLSLAEALAAEAPAMPPMLGTAFLGPAPSSAPCAAEPEASPLTLPAAAAADAADCPAPTGCLGCDSYAANACSDAAALAPAATLVDPCDLALPGRVLSPPRAESPGVADLPSVGSSGHGTGQCKPCAFLHTKGCDNGVECRFCHLCESGEKKRRHKEKIELKKAMRKAAKQAAQAASKAEEGVGSPASA